MSLRSTRRRALVALVGAAASVGVYAVATRGTLNATAAEGGLVAATSQQPAAGTPPAPLLPNPSFEDVKGDQVAGWRR